MFRYRLYDIDGNELGECAWADFVNRGERVMLGPGRTYRVLDVVPVDEAERSTYTALLKVKAAEA